MAAVQHSDSVSTLIDMQQLAKQYLKQIDAPSLCKKLNFEMQGFKHAKPTQSNGTRPNTETCTWTCTSFNLTLNYIQ